MPLKKAIATPGVPIRFEGFPGNEPWADAMAFGKRDIAGSLALIKIHRRVMGELARYFFHAWDCGYVAIVDATGTELQQCSIGLIISMLGDHMREHLATIEAIKQEHGL